MTSFDRSNGLPRACARVLGDRSNDRPVRLVTSRPGPAERERLAATLGATLRRLRTERGMGTRVLARRSAVARSTLTRLEAGERRPRASLLGGIAYGLDPDDPAPIRAELVEAAGASLVPEGPWSQARRRRAMDHGLLSGTVPLPGKVARPLALHRQADEARRRAYALMDAPAALDDGAAMAEACRLLDLSARLRAEAGPALVLRIGGQEFRAGWG